MKPAGTFDDVRCAPLKEFDASADRSFLRLAWLLLMLFEVLHCPRNSKRTRWPLVSEYANASPGGSVVCDQSSTCRKSCWVLSGTKPRGSPSSRMGPVAHHKREPARAAVVFRCWFGHPGPLAPFICLGFAIPLVFAIAAPCGTCSDQPGDTLQTCGPPSRWLLSFTLPRHSAARAWALCMLEDCAAESASAGAVGPLPHLFQDRVPFLGGRFVVFYGSHLSVSVVVRG